MRHLILWRHADAGDALRDPAADDARALSALGRKQASAMARWLNARLPAATRVLSSPAPRAAQTAAALRAEVDRDARLAPGAGSASCREAIDEAFAAVAAGGALVVVGHQPDLGTFAAGLLGGVDEGLAIRKACAWWFGVRGRSHAPVVLLGVMGPDLLAEHSP